MKTRKSTILVIDDHYAIDSSGSSLSHYDRNCFLEDYSSDRIEFIFCSAFDANCKEYSLFAVQEYLGSLNTEPDVILLDIMFGDEEFLGVDILKNLAIEYPNISVIIMTSKQKSELFEKTLSVGAVDYLVKPLNREELHHTICRYSGNKETSVVGQESSFLSVVNHVTLAKGHLLIETEDIARAISLFEYSANIRNMGFNLIDINNEQRAEDIFKKIEPKMLNLFLGLEQKTVLFQESLYLLLKESDESTSFGAICSTRIIQDIKQHGFNHNLYGLLGSTSVRLENIEMPSIDLLLLFRFHFNRLKPKELESNLLLSNGLLFKVFSSQNSLTLENILKFLEALFASHIALNNHELLEYAEQNFIQESYQDLQKNLSSLRIAEFEILLKALRKTQESGRKSNKSLAISKLLDKPQASTNKYDRWIKKVWKEIPIPKQNEYREIGSLHNLGIRF